MNRPVNRISRIVFVLGAALAAAVVAPVASAHEDAAAVTATADCAAPGVSWDFTGESAAMCKAGTPATDTSFAPKVGGEVAFDGCFPSERLSCDDLPMPQGGTCSCTTTYHARKCRSCDRGYGYVYETTCHVCGVCNTPNCNINTCNDHTAFSCE